MQNPECTMIILGKSLRVYMFQRKFKSIYVTHCCGAKDLKSKNHTWKKKKERILRKEGIAGNGVYLNKNGRNQQFILNTFRNSQQLKGSAWGTNENKQQNS